MLNGFSKDNFMKWSEIKLFNWYSLTTIADKESFKTFIIEKSSDYLLVASPGIKKFSQIRIWDIGKDYLSNIVNYAPTNEDCREVVEIIFEDWEKWEKQQ